MRRVSFTDAPTPVSSSAVVLFYKETEAHGVFSQYSKSTILDWLDRVWSSGEQFMHAMKALFFGDMASFKAICALGYDPPTVKALGRTVSPFNPDSWAAEAMHVVAYGSYLKFSQCQARRDMLLGTGASELVECSAVDKIWGVGLSVTAFLNGEPRNGLNQLGACLMLVRSKLAANAVVEPGALTSYGRTVTGGSAPLSVTKRITARMLARRNTTTGGGGRRTESKQPHSQGERKLAAEKAAAKRMTHEDKRAAAAIRARRNRRQQHLALIHI